MNTERYPSKRGHEEVLYLERICEAAVALLDVSHLSKNQQKKAKRVAYQNAKKEYERSRRHDLPSTINESKNHCGANDRDHDSTRPCILCGAVIQPGSEYKAVHLRKTAGYIWAHFACVELPPPNRPVCRHWKRYGSCAFKETCIFAHPEPSVIEGAKRSNTPKRVRKQGRQGWFRRFLLDEFGLEHLRCGSGVLDVAAGKGELSFDLLNLCGITCTAVEPRPLNLESCVRRWQEGYYGRNPAVDGEVFRHRQETCGEAESPQMPNHVQIFFDHDVVSRVIAFGKALPAGMRQPHDCTHDYCSPEGQAELSVSGDTLHSAERPGGCLDMETVSDSLPTVVISGNEHLLAKTIDEDSKALDDWFQAKMLSAKENRLMFDSHDAGDTHKDMLFKTDAPVDSVPRDPVRGACIPHRDAIRDAVDSVLLDNGNACVPVPCSGAIEGDGRGITDVGDALHAMVQCAAVVGMHPDQAAEPIVDFALALHKPFALVPCCVHAASFPGRCDTSGNPVKSYGGLVAYLCAKDARIQRRELPFDGRNVVLYFNPRSNVDFKEADVSSPPVP